MDALESLHVRYVKKKVNWSSIASITASMFQNMHRSFQRQGEKSKPLETQCKKVNRSFGSAERLALKWRKRTSEKQNKTWAEGLTKEQ